MTHARTWKDLQQRKLVPAVPLLRGREYHASHTHGDAALFLQRQIDRGLKVKEQR